MLAGRGVRLVHRAGRGDEGGECAGFQEIDRSRNEIVMQPQTHRSVGAVGADGPVRERRIADGEIEIRRQIGAREIALDDAGDRLEEPGDPRGDRIELDAGDE